VAPVSALRIVIETPGITEPEISVTVPTRAPVIEFCAANAKGQMHEKAKRNLTILIPSPFSCALARRPGIEPLYTYAQCELSSINLTQYESFMLKISHGGSNLKEAEKVEYFQIKLFIYMSISWIRLWSCSISPALRGST
jgi:hypothetical protein